LYISDFFKEKRAKVLMKFTPLLLLCSFTFANPLQDAINAATSGDTLMLNDGIYDGNVIIDKPLTIIGKGKNVIIRGDRTKSVIKVMASRVRIVNLSIEGSGKNQMNLDAGISCDGGNNLVIEQNRISDVLFGIDLKQCNQTIIRDNNITSKEGYDVPKRGDAIRAWYSHENVIENNFVYYSRDIVAWFSSNNIISRNNGHHNRYGIHTMYSSNNIIEDNKFTQSVVGLYFMFSKNSTIKRNTVINSNGAFGVGLALKDTSNFIIKDNVFLYNARGIYSDHSPLDPGTINLIENNQILYNIVGYHMHNTQEASVLKNNDFIGNMDTVTNDTPGSKIELNEWSENYFDEYEGLDLNKDGYGDFPYIHLVYADQLWQHYPNLRFFYGSTVISGLNFLARLAPFSEPIKLLQDNKPRMKPNKEKYNE